MKLVPRGLKVRTLVALVAAAALGLAFVKDRPIRRLRNGYLTYAAEYRESASEHEQAFFEATSRINSPYPKIERQTRYLDQLAEMPLAIHFRSWATEAEWHRQMTQFCREKAKECDREGEACRLRLVVPWP